MRTQKQLCKTDPGPPTVGGVPVYSGQPAAVRRQAPMRHVGLFESRVRASSLYSADAFQVPNGFVAAVRHAQRSIVAGHLDSSARRSDPYAYAPRNRPICATSNRHSIRIYRKERHGGIERRLECHAGTDLHFANRLQCRISCGPRKITTASNTPRIFAPIRLRSTPPDPSGARQITLLNPDWAAFLMSGMLSASTISTACTYGIFCDPQLGCSDRLVPRICTRTFLAVQSGIPSGVQFQGAIQFQRWRQLSALRNGRKLLRLFQHSD